jgi:hypothetical protein
MSKGGIIPLAVGFTLFTVDLFKRLGCLGGFTRLLGLIMLWFPLFEAYGFDTTGAFSCFLFWLLDRDLDLIGALI